jgi:uncharacterized protein involved in type VI secretion and phage assembly
MAIGSHRPNGFAIAAGVVKNNVDLIFEGRVQVRIPTRPSFHPWARLCAAGGSSGRGFMWIPNISDEVLVAFVEGDLSSAYILGGLWSTMHRPPATTPLDFLTKKVIQTGATAALGHQIEFDDAKQSITITTSTKQSITMDPLKISLSNLAGTVSVTLDNKTQAVSITAAGSIDLKAVKSISMKAASIELNGAKVNITGGQTTVVGAPIKLNC